MTKQTPAPTPYNHCYCGWYDGHGIDIGRLNAGWWQAVKPGWLYGCGEFGAEGLGPVLRSPQSRCGAAR